MLKSMKKSIQLKNKLSNYIAARRRREWGHSPPGSLGVYLETIKAFRQNVLPIWAQFQACERGWASGFGSQVSSCCWLCKWRLLSSSPHTCFFPSNWKPDVVSSVNRMSSEVLGLYIHSAMFLDCLFWAGPSTDPSTDRETKTHSWPLRTHGVDWTQLIRWWQSTLW